MSATGIPRQRFFIVIFILLPGLTVGRIDPGWNGKTNYSGLAFAAEEQEKKSERIPVLGPPQTAFCPDIPAGLYYGDSPQTVIEKMGRQPNDKYDGYGDMYLLPYKVAEAHGFKNANLAFGFVGDSLEGVIVSYAYTIASEDDTNVLGATGIFITIIASYSHERAKGA